MTIIFTLFTPSSLLSSLTHSSLFVQQSLSSLSRYEDTAFNPHRGVDDPQACEMAMGEYGGFWGPFVFP